jgi:TfoX/Sxy family transcriptional regulator of competence genes
MAFDPKLADLLRKEITGHGTIVEKKMFGGLAFMLNGNMAMGTYQEGGMFRVSKETAAQALAVKGTSTMTQGGREMAGFILTSADVVFDDTKRRKLAKLALAYVKTLPPK